MTHFQKRYIKDRMYSTDKREVIFHKDFLCVQKRKFALFPITVYKFKNI